MKHLLIASVLLSTFLGVASGATPVINPGGIVDGASYTTSVASGSIFIIFGSNLSNIQDPTTPSPLQNLMDGVKITFTPVAGGAGTDCFMFYVFPTQIAGLLPSTVGPGTYNVVVTNNGTPSAPVQTTVVTRKFEIIAQNGQGFGRAVAQNFISQAQVDVNRFTTVTISGVTFSPAHPGQTLILWGTGMGPITGADNTPPGAVDFSSQVSVKVLVNGQAITPFYAGRAPQFPGEDQVNFTLPNDVAQGCTVNLQVQVGTQLSNLTTLAIAPPGATACVSPFPASILTLLDQGQSITTGSFIVDSFTSVQDLSALPGGTKTSKVTIEGVSGSFSQYTADQLSSATAFYGSTGSCQVFQRTGSTASLVFGTAAINLDAGNVTVTGPGSLNQLLTETSNTYSFSNFVLPPSISLPFPIPGFSSTPVITAGNYTLTGAGGKDVGKFTATVTLGTPINVTSPSPIPDPLARNADLKVSWTGGNSSDILSIVGYSGAQTGGTAQNPIYTVGEFICTTTAGAGSFTVPGSIIGQLPVTPTDTTGTGFFGVFDSTAPSGSNGNFTAPLVAGGSIASGLFLGETGTTSPTHYK